MNNPMDPYYSIPEDLRTSFHQKIYAHLDEHASLVAEADILQKAGRNPQAYPHWKKIQGAWAANGDALIQEFITAGGTPGQLNTLALQIAGQVEGERRNRKKMLAVVAAIPPEKVARYIPEIKQLEREKLRILQAEIEEMLPLEQVLSAAYEDFLAANPASDPTEHQEWIEKERRFSEDFRKSHPEIDAAREKMAERGKNLEAIETKLLNNFCAEGGTRDQFAALHHCAMNGFFSRKEQRKVVERHIPMISEQFHRYAQAATPEASQEEYLKLQEAGQNMAREFQMTGGNKEELDKVWLELTNRNNTPAP